MNGRLQERFLIEERSEEERRQLIEKRTREAQRIYQELKKSTFHQQQPHRAKIQNRMEQQEEQEEQEAPRMASWLSYDFENQPGSLDEFCQTSVNSEFPPLTSTKQLKREGTVEKGRHTKLITKINQHIVNFGSKRKLVVHRATLADQLEDCNVSRAIC